MFLRYFNAFVLFPYLEKKSGRSITPKLEEIRKFERLSHPEQETVRKQELYKILQFSRAKIPFYKDLFGKVSFDENLILKDIRYIEKLPILTKQIVRDNSDRLKLPEAWHERKTGGSTGQSVLFFYDNVGLDWTSAVNLWAYEMAGNYPYRKDCHISSELGIKQPNLKAAFLDWLKLTSQNRKRLMINSFSDKDLTVTLKNLRKIKPYLMQGHPSSGYALANFVQKQGFKKKRYCHIFEPSGEMLTQKMVDVIEENLGCKVVNRYGNAEFGVIAHSRMADSFTRLQVCNRLFYVEEARQSNIVVSGFTNYSFPLFRYDTGDVATVRHEADGSFIYDIQGRIHDVVKIDGEDYATHYIMDYLDHKVRGVREFQIRVSFDGHVTINIVAEKDEDQRRISEELIARWPRGLTVKFVVWEDFARVGWQQKFRHLIDESIPQ